MADMAQSLPLEGLKPYLVPLRKEGWERKAKPYPSGGWLEWRHSAGKRRKTPPESFQRERLRLKLSLSEKKAVFLSGAACQWPQMEFLQAAQPRLDVGREEMETLLKCESDKALGRHLSRRKMTSKDMQGSSRSRREEHSFSDDVGHAASETLLITRLAFTLLRYLGLGYKWVTKFMALMLYAALLLPGFLQVGWYYYTSSRVTRSVPYGSQPRNRLDLYYPEESNSKRKPVVIFVTGGAWVIGYKAWGALLGQALAERGVMVACLDYRNFPQGGVSDMVNDVSTGIAWVFENIARYGGDASRIYVVGQSAGAHLSSMAILRQAMRAAAGGPVPLPWIPSQICAYFGVSGGYNLVELVEHFHNRGLYRSILHSVMEGEASLPAFSPELIAKDKAFESAAALLPPMNLFHGTDDQSIPSHASEQFADALSAAGAKVHMKFYAGKSHTDPIIQDPMRGGRDELLEDILTTVHEGDKDDALKDKTAPPRPRMVPEFLLQIARYVSPF